MFILQSSAADLDPQAIVTAYKQLLWVERAFRTLKSFLRVRPVYHFTERRIRAHIFLCVLGYLMENHLRQRLLQAGAPFSARAALKALEPLRVVTYNLPGVPVPIRACTRPIPDALAAVSALGYTLPARLPLSAAAWPGPPTSEVPVVTRPARFDLTLVGSRQSQAEQSRREGASDLQGHPQPDPIV